MDAFVFCDIAQTFVLFFMSTFIDSKARRVLEIHLVMKRTRLTRAIPCTGLPLSTNIIPSEVSLRAFFF